jgi:plasmid stabilization system protein ParE
MSRRLIVRPEAEADLAEIVRWYEEKQPGLGWQFAEEAG